MAHSHDMSCLEEVAGKLICHHGRGSAIRQTSRSGSASVGASTSNLSTDIISYRSPSHSAGKIQLVNRQATIYLKGEIISNVHKIEVAKIALLVGKYAQADSGTPAALRFAGSSESAIGVYFVPRGKRNIRLKIESYDPYLLVLDGWGHPDPASAFVESRGASGVVVSKSKYTSHDPKFSSDFDRAIEPYLARAHVLADFRGHNPHLRLGSGAA